jgi:small GTP-binding protein
MNSHFDTTYKFLILGDSSVGKTSFIQKYTNNTFNLYQKSTIGIDYSIQTAHIHNKTIRLQIWDTAGQERYKSIVKSFYHGTHGILLMYDISKEDTFNGISLWLKDINEKNKDVAIILVGNKCDLEDDNRKVPIEKGKELADSLSISFFETSAKFDINIKESFTNLVENTYRKFGIVSTENNIKIDEKEVKKRSRCC